MVRYNGLSYTEKEKNLFILLRWRGRDIVVAISGVSNVLI